ncbi:outer membrane protein assembly factor BamB family protein [Halorientalis pallida]|uniref:Pyrrolo-quinoline quinone repeat domain-containing protein n=1 Tax=Halorientalis pallida TaxID=2479928 RepID=A0A498L016_9EURY|nr:PQQ-binding-like beta-propeller repeat protein [Halorientalis pallida]RXK48394.1 hypothetical protein EAF64_11995 [Halorientalis pallida]
MYDRTTRRRQFLTASALGVAGLAGCSSGPERSDSGGSATSGATTGAAGGGGDGTADAPSPDLTVRPEKRWTVDLWGSLSRFAVGPQYAVATSGVRSDGGDSGGRAYVFDRETGERRATFELPDHPWGLGTGWADDVLVVPCHSPSVSTGRGSFYRIDLTSMRGDVTFGFDGFPLTVPSTFDSASVVVGTDLAEAGRTPTLLAYDGVAQRRRWSFDVGGPTSQLAYPFADEERIYTANRGVLYAVDRADGTARWSTAFDRGISPVRSIGSEVVFTERPGRTQERGRQWSVYSYDTAGTEQWSSPLDVVPYRAPTVTDGYRGILARRSPSRDAESVFTVLDDAGARLWTEPYGLTRAARPGARLIGEYAHLYSDRSYAIHDLRTGERVERLRQPPVGHPPIGAGGAVVYATADSVRAIDPGTLDELWRIDTGQVARLASTGQGIAVDTGDGVTLYTTAAA